MANHPPAIPGRRVGNEFYSRHFLADHFPLLYSPEWTYSHERHGMQLIQVPVQSSATRGMDAHTQRIRTIQLAAVILWRAGRQLNHPSSDPTKARNFY